MTHQAITAHLVNQCEMTWHDDLEDIVDEIIGFLAHHCMPTNEAGWIECRRIAREHAVRWRLEHR